MILDRIFGKGKKKEKHKKTSLDSIVQRSELLRDTNIVVEMNDGDEEDLGRAFFLKKNNVLYVDKECLYLTRPDGIKVGAESENKSGLLSRLSGKTVYLRFHIKDVPWEIECTMKGYYKILPEIQEALDFNTKSALKLIPVKPPRNLDKRQFLQYALMTEDQRVKTYELSMGLTAQRTNKTFEKEETLEDKLSEIKLITFEEVSKEGNIETDLKELSEYLESLDPSKRNVNVTKIVRKSDLRGSVDIQYNHGDVTLLKVNYEGAKRIFLRKSSKSDFSKDNPYNLDPGETVVIHYEHK